MVLPLQKLKWSYRNKPVHPFFLSILLGFFKLKIGNKQLINKTNSPGDCRQQIIASLWKLCYFSRMLITIYFNVGR